MELYERDGGADSHCYTRGTRLAIGAEREFSSESAGVGQHVLDHLITKRRY